MIQEKTLDLLGFNEIRARLAALTSCDLAQQMALTLTPETDRSVIAGLLAETEDAVSFVIQRGSPPLSGVSDVTGTLRHAGAGGVLSLGEFLKIAALLRACRRMRQYANSVQSEESAENHVLAYVVQLSENRHLEEDILRCILSETEVSDDASPALWDIRRKIQQAQNYIKDKLSDMIRSAKYTKALQDGVVTVRADRYCVPVKVEYRSEVSGIVHDTSSSGQTLFVEPNFVVDTNNKIRELRVAEREEIERILQTLSGEVAVLEDILRNDLQVIAYLDFLFAKARMALDMKGVQPIIGDPGQIRILQGRNPLLDRHQVVPITLEIGFPTEANGTVHRAVIVTGPNTGGKTVTLKTVGLLTVMMQCGMMVPCAEHSVLSIFTGIFADIGDEQSIAQNLSTFSAHMKNITGILESCDHQSLILLDELGAGTDPTEGAALAMSILECVYQMGATVFATTHYSELKIFASTTPGFVNASCEFDVDTLRPTYRLLIGVPGKSNAFAISEKLGLDPLIIDRAKTFLTNEDLRFEDMLTGIERSRAQIEQDQAEARRLSEEANRFYQEMEAEREALRCERNTLLDKTREQVREITNKARIAADRMLTEIRRAAIENGRESVQQAESAKASFEQETQDGMAQISTEYRTAAEQAHPPEHLQVGEQVKILSLNCVATVLSLPDDHQKVHLQAGMMKVFLPISDLKRVSSKQVGSAGKMPMSTSRGAGAMMKAASIRHELDLRGMTVDEAVSMIDQQIHDGLLAKQGSFTVIHGKGTGALRKGIHDYLKRCRYVKDYRLGAYGEGDTGVTMITLK